MENEITLRPIEYNDLDSLFEWRNNPEIFSQLGGGYFPVSKTAMDSWMVNFCKNDKTNIRFIISYNDKSVGYITLASVNYINQSAELGIYIGEKGFEGKGIASRAIDKLEEFAMEYLNLRKIKLLVNSENSKAVNLYKRKNFREIGIYEKERFIKGKWEDVKIMEKLI
ncbi:GNAT family N-acetyltransferase [Staphylococcus equorum]